MSELLQQIVDSTLVHNQKLSDINDLPPSEVSFLKPFEDSGYFGLVAEMKQTSPSTGALVSDYHPASIAKQYQQGGASALSVLTNQQYFGGCFEDLKQVRKVSELPILCKDFILDVKQIRHARQNGADACLLIVKILSDEQLLRLKQAIESLNMTALIEVYDQTDLDRALAMDPKVIGINNRNLNTLELDCARAKALLFQVPKHIPVLSLSGMQSPQEASAIRELGFKGVLVGTALMRNGNPAAFIARAIEFLK